MRAAIQSMFIGPPRVIGGGGGAADDHARLRSELE
jgi:hypothetical protein